MTEIDALGQIGLPAVILVAVIILRRVMFRLLRRVIRGMRRAAEIAKTLDVTCLVSLENNMACGFGVCLGCAAPRSSGGFGLVCRDGPVFDAETIAWEGLP